MLAVARKTLVWASIKRFSSSVMRVSHGRFSSMRAYAVREPLRAWIAFTAGVKATSLDGIGLVLTFDSALRFAVRNEA